MYCIRKSGGYRGLRSFQFSTIIYDATYWFCERFVIGDPELSTKWFRQREAVAKTLPRDRERPQS